MNALRFLSTLALLTVAGAASAAPRTCGTQTPDAATLSRAQQRAAARTSTACGGTIVVALHVITSGGSGAIPATAIAAQMAEINANYAPWGYSFVLGSVDYTDNAAWFNNDSQADEDAMTAALAIDPAHTLNIYTGILYGGYYLGYAYLPWSWSESDVHNGVFLEYRTFPGYGYVPFHLGRTATHEIGHYLGLLHTFEGGCAAPGDYIADTPAELDPNVGCPIGMDSCPADPGLDPIHNYMDYTDDACYTEFSPGQSAWMCDQIATYRPHLLSGGPTPARVASWGSLKLRYH
jgi:hypothetical protein